MKKFSRIMLMLLMLVAIVTAFAVVAIAEEDVVLSPVTTGGYDFEDKTPGDTFNDSTSKLGKWTIGSADNGNVYVISEYADATGTNGDNWDVTVPNWFSYPVDEYPTFAFDFDVMSNTGDYHWSATIRTDLYGGAHSARISQMKSVKLNADGIKLKSLANVWQHVTYVVRYEGNGVFGLYFYVDGVLSASSSIDYNVTAFSAKDGRYTFTNWNDAYDEGGNLIVEGLADENDNLKLDRLSVGTISLYSPYRDSTSGEKISYDNMKFTFYPEGYDNAAVASYIYNEDYEMPYGQTEATLTDKETGNVTWYDDFNAAFEAANETNILTVMKDTVGTYEINKTMNVNMNGFAFDYFSNTGYVPTVNGDVFEFALSDKLVNVVWDPACSDEECTCFGSGIGHELTATSIVALGYVPEYNASTFINKEGVYAEFLGWSYTKGGEAEALTAVTDEQVAAGTLYLYPVYNIVKYDGALIDASGEYSFFMEDEFEANIASAIATAGVETIVLYSDIEYYKSFALPANAALKIDLNGHTLTRVNLYGAVKNYDAASGTYVDGTATTSAEFIFTISNVKGINLTITSSKEGAVLRSVSVDGTAWYDENGKLERYEASSVKGGSFIYNYCAGGTFNIENMDIFALNIQYGSHNTSPEQNINITNCRFYRTPGSETTGGWGYDCLYLAGTVNFTAKDSLFYLPAASVLQTNVRLIRMQGAAKANIVFDNCDVISDNASVSLLLESTNHTLTYTNCRLYNYSNESATYLANFGKDVIIGNTPNLYNRGNVSDGCIMMDKAQTITYSLPTNSRITIDAETKLPVFDFAFADRDISFVKQVALYTDVYVTVTWLDENGEVIKAVDELRGTIATAPEHIVALENGWVGVLVTKWLDEENNDADLLVTDAVSYTFKANPVVDEDTAYAGKITLAKFNYIYYNKFNTVLYLPVTEGVTTPAVSGFSEESFIVTIDGKEYWAYTKDNTTAEISEDFESTVTFTKDGVEYSDVLVTNALIYAEAVLSNPESDAEKAAVANFVRYVKEARLVTSLEVSEKFDELIALGEIAELGAKESYADETVDIAGLSDYITSIRFMLDGSYAGYVITLTQAAIDLGAEVSVTKLDTEEALSVRESTTVANSKLTNQTRVYDLVGAVKITVTVPAAEEGAAPTVVTGTYSAKAYINATDNSLAKAMYEFGVAVAAYRATIV